MVSLRIDKVSMSSAFPGFGYDEILSTSLVISGSVPDGGKVFSVSATIPDDKFIIAYYRNPDYTDVPAYTNERIRINNLPYAFVDSPNSSTISGATNGDTYTVSVFFGNFTGSPVTAATQTLHIDIYVFSRPFN